MYRRLLALYPRPFREEFGDDLVAFHDELAADLGRATAWRRTGLDLLITVPRYRLEHVMSEKHSTGVLYAVLAGLVVVGAAGFLTGLYPAALALVAAIVVAVAQRSQLARAIRTPDTDTRRHRLRLAGACALLFALTIVAWSWDIADDQLDAIGIVASLVGTAAMLGALVLLVAGLLTPRTPATV